MRRQQLVANIAGLISLVLFFVLIVGPVFGPELTGLAAGICAAPIVWRVTQ